MFAAIPDAGGNPDSILFGPAASSLTLLSKLMAELNNSLHRTMDDSFKSLENKLKGNFKSSTGGLEVLDEDSFRGHFKKVERK